MRWCNDHLCTCSQTIVPTITCTHIASLDALKLIVFLDTISGNLVHLREIRKCAKERDCGQVRLACLIMLQLYLWLFIFSYSANTVFLVCVCICCFILACLNMLASAMWLYVQALLLCSPFSLCLQVCLLSKAIFCLAVMLLFMYWCWGYFCRWLHFGHVVWSYSVVYKMISRAIILQAFKKTVTVSWIQEGKDS